jgi:CspA family cold shock protein
MEVMDEFQNPLNEGAKVSYEEVPNKGKTSAENLRVG